MCRFAYNDFDTGTIRIPAVVHLIAYCEWYPGALLCKWYFMLITLDGGGLHFKWCVGQCCCHKIWKDRAIESTRHKREEWGKK